MKKFFKINQYIRHPKVRVIDGNGENLGVLDLNVALEKAAANGMDLVEVTDKSNPPVCRIIDFRKFHYQEQKKHQQSFKKGKSQEIKEVRFTPFIGKADFESRIKKIKSFLETGDKVKLTVKFTGRQITHKDFGDRILDNTLKELIDLYNVEQNKKLQGKLLYMIIKPK